MKPPSNKAIKEALSIILKSINEENETSFPLEKQKPIDLKGFTMEQLEEASEALETARRSLSDELGDRLATLRIQRNSMLQVHKLPPEVLADIIHHSMNPGSLTTGSLWHLSTVATRWWDIIRTSPELWNHISSLQDAELKLTKSKSAPLTIAYYGWESSALQEFMKLLAPHSDRWRSLRLESESGYWGLEEQLGAETPMLEELELLNVYDHSSSAIDIKGGPNLRVVKLARIPVARWEPSVFKGLEELSIQQPLGDTTPSLKEFTEILDACPQLRKLSLTDITLRQEEQPPPPNRFSFSAGNNPTPRTATPPPPAKISMPKLEKLTMEGVPADLVVALLHGLDAEVLKSVKVDRMNTGLPWTGRDGALNPVLRADRGLRVLEKVMKKAEIEDITLSISPQHIRIQARKSYNDPNVVLVNFKNSESATVLEALKAHRPFANIGLPINVNLCGDAWSGVDEYDPSFLDGIPTMVSISFGRDLNTTRVIEHLANMEKIVENGVLRHQWACPRLSWLGIQSSSDGTDDMITARNDDYNNSQLPPPAPEGETATTEAEPATEPVESTDAPAATDEAAPADPAPAVPDAPVADPEPANPDAPVAVEPVVPAPAEVVEPAPVGDEPVVVVVAPGADVPAGAAEVVVVPPPAAEEPAANPDAAEEPVIVIDAPAAVVDAPAAEVVVIPVPDAGEPAVADPAPAEPAVAEPAPAEAAPVEAAPADADAPPIPDAPAAEGEPAAEPAGVEDVPEAEAEAAPEGEAAETSEEDKEKEKEEEKPAKEKPIPGTPTNLIGTISTRYIDEPDE